MTTNNTADPIATVFVWAVFLAFFAFVCFGVPIYPKPTPTPTCACPDEPEP